MDLVDVNPGDTAVTDQLLPVLRELRPHLTRELFDRVYANAYPQGLRFLAALEQNDCVGVAGWRIVINTSAGSKLYIDDLVTTEAARSQGVGAALLTELERRARQAGCTVLDLDSGVQRPDAHRFYFRESLAIRSFHFAKTLE